METAGRHSSEGVQLPQVGVSERRAGEIESVEPDEPNALP
mgnify:FL=1